MPVEIERKFLVGELPELPRFARPQQLHQIYIARADGMEVRIRKAGRRHWLTIKTGSGLARQEHEILLSHRQYQTLRHSDSSPSITKVRYRLPLNNTTAELDIYGGTLTGLKVVEVEFPDTTEANLFVPPLWFGPEVTTAEEFSNANLASLDREAAQRVLGAILEPPRISYGAIPIIRFDGQPMVVLVTTKSMSRWIFPKGTPEDSKSPEDIALEEAAEEAGVEGRLVGPALSLGYWKERQYYRIMYWPMEVSSIHDQWDEASVRQRIVCTPEEAGAYLDNPGFAHALSEALKRVSIR